MYSKSNGGSYYKVGATFSAYEFAGKLLYSKWIELLLVNTVCHLLCVLTYRWERQTLTSVDPLHSQSKDMIFNTLRGAGIEDGDISTLVSGGAMTIQGYAAVMVANPYRSFLLYSMETPY
jgi:hypothetical protein